MLRIDDIFCFSTHRLSKISPLLLYNLNWLFIRISQSTLNFGFHSNSSINAQNNVVFASFLVIFHFFLVCIKSSRHLSQDYIIHLVSRWWRAKKKFGFNWISNECAVCIWYFHSSFFILHSMSGYCLLPAEQFNEIQTEKLMKFVNMEDRHFDQLNKIVDMPVEIMNWRQSTYKCHFSAPTLPKQSLNFIIWLNKGRKIYFLHFQCIFSWFFFLWVPKSLFSFRVISNVNFECLAYLLSMVLMNAESM